MASTNSNPTLEEIRNIEKSWNSGLQADYDAIAAKYPEHNLADLKPQVKDWLPNRSDVHPVTGEAIIMGFNFLRFLGIIISIKNQIAKIFINFFAQYHSRIRATHRINC